MKSDASAAGMPAAYVVITVGKRKPDTSIPTCHAGAKPTGTGGTRGFVGRWTRAVLARARRSKRVVRNATRYVDAPLAAVTFAIFAVARRLVIAATSMSVSFAQRTTSPRLLASSAGK